MNALTDSSSSFFFLRRPLPFLALFGAARFGVSSSSLLPSFPSWPPLPPAFPPDAGGSAGGSLSGAPEAESLLVSSFPEDCFLSLALPDLLGRRPSLPSTSSGRFG